MLCIAGRYLTVIGVISLLTQTIPFALAEENAGPTPLPDRTYRPPTDAEVETFRDFLSRVDIEQSIPDRFAYRCEAMMFDDNGPERFVSIHAVDRDRDAVRHVVRRTFTDDDDPILSFSIEDSQGFADSRTSNAGIFPRRHDWLRVGEKVFLSTDVSAAVSRDKIKLTGEDRNFNPSTVSLLPMSSFFRGIASKKRVSEIFGIDVLRPEEVSVAGTSFVAKIHLDGDEHPAGIFMFIEFANEAPVTYEIWQLIKDRKQLRFRTVSKWQRFEEVRFPIRIEGLKTRGPLTYAVEANLEWRFNEDVPDRLFEVSDVTSKTALEW